MVEKFLAETIAALLTESSPMAARIAKRIRTMLCLSPSAKITPAHVIEAAILKSKEDIPL